MEIIWKLSKSSKEHMKHYSQNRLLPWNSKQVFLNRTWSIYIPQYKDQGLPFTVTVTSVLDTVPTVLLATHL